MSAMCRILIIVFLFILSCKDAHADAGIPMIALGIPFFILALIPVILIEASIYRKQLGITFKKSIKGSTLANLSSTLVGYPLSWFVHLGLTMLVAYLEFRGPAQSNFLSYILFPLTSAVVMSISPWQLCLAGIFGLIPAFFISVPLENNILKKIFNECEPQRVRNSVWQANKITYFILAAILFVLFLIFFLTFLKPFDIFFEWYHLIHN